jgi:hypothetical protein
MIFSGTLTSLYFSIPHIVWYVLAYASFIVFAYLEVQTISTTNKFLKIPGDYELNPINAFFEKYLGVYWYIPKVLFCMAISVVCLYVMPIVGGWFLMVISGLVAWADAQNNWDLIHKTRPTT